MAGAAVIVVAIVAVIVALLAMTGGDDDGGQVANGGNEDSTSGGSPSPTFASRLPETDETVGPETTPPPNVEIVSPPPGFSPALPLSSQSECQVRTSAVVLNWQTSDSGGEQLVDLAADFDVFTPGRYVTSQVLSNDADSLTWKGLIPGVVYFWRVNTRIDSQWVPGQSSSFVAEACPPLDQM